MTEDKPIVLIDGRELKVKNTGISRVLMGLVSYLAENPKIGAIHLFVYNYIKNSDYHQFKSKVKKIFLSPHPIISELQIYSRILKGCDVFISPYPKLPLGLKKGKFVNTIHDVFYIDNGKKSFKNFVRKYRLNSALKKSDLTWYDSEFSLKETKNLIGHTGKNPKVRYPGLDNIFYAEPLNGQCVLEKYNLSKGYILIIGNGRAHKNPELIIALGNQIERKIVFVGVDRVNKERLVPKDKFNQCIWIENVDDHELKTLIKNAFCVVQPSFKEGYGYPPLEAMAVGTPAITSNIPVLLETTGGNCLSASPDSIADWKESIHKLEDQFLYENQVEKGFKWIEQFKGKNAWGKYMHDIEKLVEDAN